MLPINWAEKNLTVPALEIMADLFISHKKYRIAITMNVYIISFGTNPQIVDKFQTGRFRTFDEMRAEEKK